MLLWVDYYVVGALDGFCHRHYSLEGCHVTSNTTSAHIEKVASKAVSCYHYTTKLTLSLGGIRTPTIN